ncbi:lysis protein [Erwinia sp. S38]|uniref:lysis protein n=1 Tax=Erwinia sp. S38 TaxID=2769338 RepID=UPI00190B120B|nr:lysis protein [Erwinia sp. S38]MBK0004364.1 lysis protein [Erwinia sp. S38]
MKDTKITLVLVAVFLLLLILLGGAAVYYHGQYQAADKRADEATTLAKQRQETINDMQVRQRDVAALDAKYTGELADAKATIDQLERDVATGKRRLQLNARCPSNGATTTSGLGDATAPRLTDSAERDYFTLREGIITITGQVNYLQQYIREQCLK